MPQSAAPTTQWPFQSPRPRGRTRRASAASAAPRQCRFNPRVLAGGRDVCARHRKIYRQFQSPRPRGRTRHSVRFVFLSRVMFQSPCPYNLAISQSRNLAPSQSRNNGLLAASGGGAESQNKGENLPGGDRNQRFATLVHDKRKPLNARRMPMLSFVSTPPPREHWTQWNKQHPGLPGKTDALLSRYRFFRII